MTVCLANHHFPTCNEQLENVTFLFVLVESDALKRMRSEKTITNIRNDEGNKYTGKMNEFRLSW